MRLSFKSAADITLDGITFDNPTDVRSVLAGFPALDRLSVTNPAFHRQLAPLTMNHDVDLQHLVPPKIRDLELGEMHSHQTHILDWFSSHATLVNLPSLNVGSLALSNVEHQCINND